MIYYYSTASSSSEMKFFLHPTRHKIGHFDVLPIRFLALELNKIKSNKTKANIRQ